MDNLTMTSDEGLLRFVSAVYEPKEDITAYELALIVPHLLGVGMSEEAWEKLGSAQRHLRRIDGAG